MLLHITFSEQWRKAYWVVWITTCAWLIWILSPYSILAFSYAPYAFSHPWAADQVIKVSPGTRKKAL